MTSASEAVSAETRVARELATAPKRNGVPYVFGILSGGSSIDVIEACRAEDIPFVLFSTRLPRRLWRWCAAS